MIKFDMPDRSIIEIRNAVLDFNGTIATESMTRSLIIPRMFSRTPFIVRIRFMSSVSSIFIALTITTRTSCHFNILGV
jgi:hypothetical protein